LALPADDRADGAALAGFDKNQWAQLGDYDSWDNRELFTAARTHLRSLPSHVRLDLSVGTESDNTEDTAAFAKLLDELKPAGLDYRFTHRHRASAPKRRTTWSFVHRIHPAIDAAKFALFDALITFRCVDLRQRPVVGASVRFALRLLGVIDATQMEIHFRERLS
jgi:hypothetical protein